MYTTAYLEDFTHKVFEKMGESVPEGYVQDVNGSPSSNPHILKEGGSMLTFR